MYIIPKSIINNNIQNEALPSWKMLLEYIEKVKQENSTTFDPAKFLGRELFSQITTLPPSIGELENVRFMLLNASQLTRLPIEIGKMKSLTGFNAYTSYHLQWYPYEILECKNLTSTKVSTRALFGNYKTNLAFPSLTKTPVKYTTSTIPCSVCKTQIDPNTVAQQWVRRKVGLDRLPLLANICSIDCEKKLLPNEQRL